MAAVPGPPKPAEHDRMLPDRARERSREKDAADKQRSASGRTERDVRPDHSRDDRGRDLSRGVTDRQPVKTAITTTAATTDSRAKPSSSSSAGGQLTTSTQSRSSSTSIPARSDMTADRSTTRVCNFGIFIV